MSAKKRGLGRGLDALFVDNEVSSREFSEETVKLSQIEPNKEQPRKNFDNDSLIELAESIKAHGLIQPILVRPVGESQYQIIAGERRWRASRIAGLTEVPVIIKEMSNSDVMKIALVENLQREDLNPLEESLGYQKLIDEFNLTQEEVSKAVGKPRSLVANALRILNLPEEVKQMIINSEISKGHGKVLLSLEYDEMLHFAKMIDVKKWSVRELEKAIRNKGKEVSEKNAQQQKPFYLEVQYSLSEHLGTEVRVKDSKSKKTLEIDFFSEEDLKTIIDKLSL
ncbi:MAG: ParB/RepB/Spo0J family partition protein [Oscillospiraceae bacterium]